MINIQNAFCFLGIHDWYSGRFQTGKKSEWTGDHIGVDGRVCLVCDKKQKLENGGKYVDTDSFEVEEVLS
jgi:hypothetical protein